MSDAIALWQKVFGSDYFIDTKALREREIAAWSAERHVSSTGRVTASVPAVGPSVAVPTHRFYGDVD
jgi:hypothetical protein